MRTEISIPNTTTTTTTTTTTHSTIIIAPLIEIKNYQKQAVAGRRPPAAGGEKPAPADRVLSGTIPGSKKLGGSWGEIL